MLVKNKYPYSRSLRAVFQWGVDPNVPGPFAYPQRTRFSVPFCSFGMMDNSGTITPSHERGTNGLTSLRPTCSFAQ